jgi:hypothetical protein
MPKTGSVRITAELLMNTDSSTYQIVAKKAAIYPVSADP